MDFLRNVEEKRNILKNSAEPVPVKVQTLTDGTFWTVDQDLLFCGLELMIRIVLRSFLNGNFS